MKPSALLKALVPEALLPVPTAELALDAPLASATGPQAKLDVGEDTLAPCVLPLASAQVISARAAGANSRDTAMNAQPASRTVLRRHNILDITSPHAIDDLPRLPFAEKCGAKRDSEAVASVKRHLSFEGGIESIAFSYA